jgi:carboxyl-terminal processing protease
MVLFLMTLSIVFSSFITIQLTSSEAQQSEQPQAPVSNNEQPAMKPHDQLAHSDSDQLAKIKEAYDIIKQHYALELDEEALIEGAIAGMLDALDDPYTVYMNRQSAEQFKRSLSSSFEGIGAEVMMREGRVTVVAPIKGSPAEKAGVRPHDQIISVNGENVEGMDLYQAVLKIRGPKNTEAVLEIERPGLTDTITITVVRDEIPLQTVYFETIEEAGLTFGKIQLTSFSAKTAGEFKEALEQLEREGIAGLIIDVRGNPGGYLDAVREIGDLVVPNQSIITEIENRAGQKVVYRSTLQESKPYPIVTLINNGSASASEILAVALQEAGGYKVIGQPSFGKGTVQGAIPMSDNSEIKITMARWLTPLENWINETGVQPDIIVEQPDFYFAAPIQGELPFKRDMNSSQISNLQLILSALGFDPGRQDGFYSDQTEAAVQQFQRAHSLAVNGQVDQDTAIKLQDELIDLIRNPSTDLQLRKAIEVLLDQRR